MGSRGGAAPAGRSADSAGRPPPHRWSAGLRSDRRVPRLRVPRRGKPAWLPGRALGSGARMNEPVEVHLAGVGQEVVDAEPRALGVVDLPLPSEDSQEPAAAVTAPPWRAARPAPATVVVLRRGRERHASAPPTRAVVTVRRVRYAGRPQERTPVNLGRQPPPVRARPGGAGGGRSPRTGGGERWPPTAGRHRGTRRDPRGDAGRVTAPGEPRRLSGEGSRPGHCRDDPGGLEGPLGLRNALRCRLCEPGVRSISTCPRFSTVSIKMQSRGRPRQGGQATRFSFFSWPWTKGPPHLPAAGSR